MELLEAYDFTMNKVKELREGGIEMSFTPPSLKNDKKLVQEVKNEGGLPSDKWVRVTFQNIDEIQVEKIRQATVYLAMCGITFDCGGECRNMRDWEIDWSFRSTGKEESERMEAIDEMEDDINSRGDCE